MFLQVAAVTELVHQVDIVRGPQHLFELDHARMLDRLQNTDFVLGQLAQFPHFLELARFNYFYRHYFIVVDALPFVYFPFLILFWFI